MFVRDEWSSWSNVIPVSVQFALNEDVMLLLLLLMMMIII